MTNESMRLDVIIVGVGGQGILLASRVMGRLAMDLGMDVKVSEVHGMSQRGGDVITHVRIATGVRSPLIDEGTADAIIAFELMEATRALAFLRPGGRIITSTQQIAPMPVLAGSAEYPQGLIEALRMWGGEAATPLIALDALGIAQACGAPRAANIVLLGAFAQGQGGASQAQWMQAVDACVPPKTIESNRRAFRAGWEAADSNASDESTRD